jgi:hypothetical protein
MNCEAKLQQGQEIEKPPQYPLALRGMSDARLKELNSRKKTISDLQWVFGRA